MKTIFITGGSEGIGRSIAERLAPHHTVIIASSDEAKLKSTATVIGCHYVTCDVRDYQSVQSAIKTVVAKHGRIDCLINNAGLWIEGPLETNAVDRIHQVLEVNTLGTIYASHAAVPIMKQQGGGRIINVISQAGLHAKSNVSVYDASKWAITGFTQALQLELAPHHIGVTGLYPGKVDTELFSKAGITKNMSNALQPSDVAKTVEFMLSFPDTTVFPEIGLKYLGS